MKWMNKPIDHTVDPNPYDGPILRADGRRSFNRYFWPMAGDSWWAYNEDAFWRVSGRFHFEVIGLADGRWSTYGSVSSIEKNEDPWGHPCVYGSREKAIRIAAARFIRMCRRARRWSGSDHMTEEMAARVINWALAIAKRPPQTLAPLPAPPAAPPPPTGLPLLDYLSSL
jgi:hypothetical protein